MFTQMGDSKIDSVLCVRIKRLTHFQGSTFQRAESYIRVRFPKRKVKRKTTLGSVQGPNGYYWNETLNFPVARDGLSDESLILELKHRKRFGQTDVLGSVEVQLAALRGPFSIKNATMLKDRYGMSVGTIHYELVLRPERVSPLPSVGSGETSHHSDNAGSYVWLGSERSNSSVPSLQSQGSGGPRVYGQQKMSYAGLSQSFPERQGSAPVVYSSFAASKESGRGSSYW